MAKWEIRHWDGTSEKSVGEMPGNLSESEILQVLQRLACMSLKPQEILSASLRRGSRQRSAVLDRAGFGLPVQVDSGDGFYSANLVE
ncbi:hypothetical protein [Leisingera aquaemixtae]|uniref:hypothetical protein n=1 Tax=Leisingera aquaemixtae TaxID=1396826 RepID=UPI001AD7F50E|nr:hypothetical protein [Leisingera aquaemixtae]